jgi:histidine triad (HIT) family protein
MKTNCIFCKIVANTIPSFKVYEDNYTLAFLDIAPVNPGHVVIVSKFHASNLDDVDDLMLAYMMRTVKRVGQAMRSGLGIKGYNVIVNNGKVAGQLIDHTHIHVIPRHEKDGLTNWPQTKYKDDEARKIMAKLKAVVKTCE